MKDHNNILEGEENGSNKEQRLEGNAREENERLKLSLSRVVKDYQTNFSSHIEENEESELVSLSLGISSKGQPIMDEKKNNTNRDREKLKEDGNLGEGLALGLNIKFDPLGNEDQGKEEELIAEKWPPSKVLKTTRTGDISEASQHTQPKKARVCIRARCDTQTMNDGCHWRKYGQKMAKGNPCPRAYYRCTVSPSCPVRKQVQRCAEDMSILITTYEGTHDHPLPTSATAIAYTTSAAASMLQSPSLSSQQGLANSNSTTFPIVNSDVAYNLYALNYTSPTMINHQLTSRPQQLYLNNSSNISSPSNYHPTITLDLTTPQTNSSFHIGKFPPTPFSSTPKHSSTTNFNVSPTITPLQSSMIKSTWSPYSGCFNYGGLITAQNRNQYGSLMNNEKRPIFQGHLYQPNYIMSNHAISQQPLTNSIATTTKTITTNPKFQSALAAALTTCVDGNATTCGGVKENHVVVESAPLSLKLGEDIPYTKDTVHSTSSQNGT